MVCLSSALILSVFISVRGLQFLIERYLSKINRNYYSDKAKQAIAMKTLSLSKDDMERTSTYTEDKYKFGLLSSTISIVVTLAFIGLGGLGLLEREAMALAESIGAGSITVGLFFFGLIMIASMLVNLPFDYYRTFKLEEKHGYNRQTVKGFFMDRIKGIGIGVVLGAGILSAILWIMEAMGETWWIWAWVAMSSFSILTAWIYPTFLAPMFNKFSPVEDKELKDKINTLAEKIGFKTDGLFVMDASKRSSHGNAYFTGVFGKKRIVLFDTLIEAMSADEIVAVLAHELGHFKLHHVRWQLIRGIAMTGVTFYLLGLCLPLVDFYTAFGLSGVTNFGALVVFGLWFGIIDFIMQPLENFLSRKNEFAADAFAKAHVGGSEKLCSALLKLRERSNVMPISHPLFSSFYHSHPPLLERLSTMGYAESPAS